jgi:protein-S-isoprenylcysteine O-methyltransferase Ste14
MMTQKRSLFADWSEVASRVLVGGLFLALAWRLGEDFLQTGRPTDLLLIVGESLVVILTCLRRPAKTVDRRLIVRIVTTASMMSPFLIQPAQGAGVIPEATAALMAAFGLVIVVAGKISLGWSFGLLPANRGIIDHGLYRIIRHPIYLGYLMTHGAFLAAHPTMWNVSVLLAGDVALIVRAFFEEQTLSRDPKYVRYCKTVKWRLVPGVC